jgi:hypothetical protein
VNPSSENWKLGGGAIVLIIIVIPMWREFQVPGENGWNIFLAVVLITLAIAAFFLQRYLRNNIAEVGEATFDTRNSGERND